jgi:hypothetical protein
MSSSFSGVKQMKLEFRRRSAILHAMMRTGVSKMDPNVDSLAEQVQFCIGYGRDI